MTYQRGMKPSSGSPCWAATMPAADRVPAVMNTPTSDSPWAIS